MVRKGKTYYAIMGVVSEAKKKGPQPPRIWVSSEWMRKRVEEIAEEMGQKVITIVADGKQRHG